jgi:hypothetical protein
MENIVFDYGVSKSRTCDAVKWEEKAARDFELFKLRGIHTRDDILTILDKGCQGIEKPRKNSLIPFKKSLNGEHTAEKKDLTAGGQSLES